ncbi:hypothetical protein A5742_16405 [Mycolicibacterium fortuitum]|uniref:Uncharacterized protein n=1 Tax=Mycolicibacterium fortuitum TaxID=1766 RepID=A0ABD6QUB6_MYCFO|nr:hypothetical protein A5742_16405 [Mycolicibacterium fortuitum]
MCSPELTRGMCQICTGTLTPDTTHVDRYGNVWDVHKGVCAIHAGEVPHGHEFTYGWFMRRIHSASTQSVRQEIIKAFYKWVKEIADEDHYDMSGPTN